jgi:tRNA A-37 threonylcarbamoyl transferase component Bud32
MHGKGVFHGDLKAGNILVRDHGDAPPEILFLDLEAVRFQRRVSRRKVVLNLAQLDASLPACVSPTDRLRFLCRYGREKMPRDHLRGLARDALQISIKRRSGRT